MPPATSSSNTDPDAPKENRGHNPGFFMHGTARKSRRQRVQVGFSHRGVS
jgi:hypothetical protein